MRDNHEEIRCDNCGTLLGTILCDGHDYYCEAEYKCRICGEKKLIRRASKKKTLFVKGNPYERG